MTKPIKTWKLLLIYVALIFSITFSLIANFYPNLFFALGGFVLLSVLQLTIRRIYIRQEFIFAEFESLRAVLSHEEKK